jgi:hypothetical protein
MWPCHVASAGEKGSRRDRRHRHPFSAGGIAIGEHSALDRHSHPVNHQFESGVAGCAVGAG